MDDETAEIELVCMCTWKAWPPLQWLPSVAGAEPTENAPNLQANDMYEYNCLLYNFSLTWLAILDSFDTRLAKLEKSILPLYTAAQILNRRSHSMQAIYIKCSEIVDVFMARYRSGIVQNRRDG